MENKSLKYWKIFAIILIALNITLIVFLLVKPFSGRPPEQKPGDAGNYMIKTLKFDKQQEEELQQLRNKHRNEEMRLLDSLKTIKKNFFDLLSSENDEKSNVYAQCIGNIESERVLNTFNHFKEVKKICTPEQKLIFNNIIHEVLKRMAPPPPKRDDRMPPENDKVHQ